MRAISDGINAKKAAVGVWSPNRPVLAEQRGTDYRDLCPLHPQRSDTASSGRAEQCSGTAMVVHNYTEGILMGFYSCVGQ